MRERVEEMGGMDGERLRMAVIGVGLFGENHARAYSACPRSRLACVCDTHEARAKEVAERYDCEWTTDYREVARSSEIDAVSVATPDFAHFEPCMAVLEGGKHLLVEKPLATDVEEAKRILELSVARNRTLMVDFHNRWNPPLVAAKEAIDNGRIGKPVMGYARLSNPLSVPTEMLSWSGRSGPHWFLLPHIVDLVGWLLDDHEPIEVTAAGSKGVLQARGIDTYDALQALVRFRDAFVTFETAWVLPNSSPSIIDFKVNLVGESGRISAVMDEAGLEVASSDFRYPMFSGSFESHGKTKGFIYEPIEHFVDCVLEDREPDVTGRHGWAVTRIIDAITRSIESGKTVHLKES